MPPFQYETSVKLHQTDAAGIMFFGQMFFVAHDAYQAFVEQAGFSFARTLADGAHLLPIVHAEADYAMPLKVGDRVTVDLHCARIGNSSFTLAYEIRRGRELCGTVQTVHVWVELPAMNKTSLPENIRLALATIARQLPASGAPPTA